MAVYTQGTRELRRVLDASQTGLGAFGDAAVMPDGRIVVTGGNALAICSPGEHGAGFGCLEYGGRQLGLTQFHDPVVNGARGLLVAGASPETGDQRLIGFDGGRWRTVWQGDGARLSGWTSEDGTIWIQKARDLFRLRRGRLEPVPRQGALLGAINWVAPQLGGGLLVGTTQGLARYSPALWQSPVELEDRALRAVNAIEDHNGRLWLCYTDRIMRVEGGTVLEYPMPKGTTINEYPTALQGGGNVVGVSGDRQKLVIFDTEQRQYREMHHPAGRTFGPALASRPDGTVWVQVTGVGLDRLRLDVFDGQAIRPAIDTQAKFPVEFIKFIDEHDAGDVWFGGPGGLAATTTER